MWPYLDKVCVPLITMFRCTPEGILWLTPSVSLTLLCWHSFNLYQAICKTVMTVAKPIIAEQIPKYKIDSVEFEVLTLGSLPPTFQGLFDPSHSLPLSKHVHTHTHTWSHPQFYACYHFLCCFCWFKECIQDDTTLNYVWLFAQKKNLCVIVLFLLCSLLLCNSIVSEYSFLVSWYVRNESLCHWWERINYGTILEVGRQS